MKQTVCELFAGVGGFRCGLNHIHSLEDLEKPESWETVWFSQWEPAETKTQYAHDCYVYRFGPSTDLDGNDTTNFNIEDVDKAKIPDFNLLVGGFPCQDYSVASSLATSKGIEGKKGVLWWSIRDILETKQPAFVLLENVDRLIKSPAKQRGRDFGIILACFRDLGYTVEWRVINAAEYGYQQRRRRTFIFAYRKDTEYFKSKKDCLEMAARYEQDLKAADQASADYLGNIGFFASTFPVHHVQESAVTKKSIAGVPVGTISEDFSFWFENTGFLYGDTIYTTKTLPHYNGKQITLGDILDEGDVSEEYFIPADKLYYTDPEITHSDESETPLPKESRLTWQYLKGAKKILRKSTNGHEYVFTEGAIPLVDEYDKPARTMLTSEGSFSRTTHIVRDKKTGRIRLLTPTETERIQGFPTNHTQHCLMNGEVIEMPSKKRRFMMGNALVVNLIEDMERTLTDIFAKEP